MVRNADRGALGQRSAEDAVCGGRSGSDRAIAGGQLLNVEARGRPIQTEERGGVRPSERRSRSSATAAHADLVDTRAEQRVSSSRGATLGAPARAVSSGTSERLPSLFDFALDP